MAVGGGVDVPSPEALSTFVGDFLLDKEEVGEGRLTDGAAEKETLSEGV